MNPPNEYEPAGTLGQQLRFYRLKRDMTLDEVALPEFSPDFVAAIEQDVFAPSSLSLALLAARLCIAGDTLPAAEDMPAPEFALVEQDLAYQLDQARRAIDCGNGQEGLRLLDDARQSIASRWPEISAYNKFRLYQLRGHAFLRLYNPAAAAPELLAALEFATQVDDGGDAVIRTRNMLGSIYYQQDQPWLALREYDFCLKSLNESTDRNLRLLVYSNLAANYFSLDEPRHAIASYVQALEFLEAVNNREREAAIYWGMSSAYIQVADATAEPEYSKMENLSLAKLNAQKALDIYEAAGNKITIGQMRANMGEILIKQKEFDQAEQMLRGACELLDIASNPFYAGNIAEQFAELELQRGRLEAAHEHARQGLAIVAREYGRVADNFVDRSGHAHLLRTYIRLLRISARIAGAQLDFATAEVSLQKALELAEQADAWKLAHDAAYAYADSLNARAMYQQAVVYYRMAVKYAKISR